MHLDNQKYKSSGQFSRDEIVVERVVWNAFAFDPQMEKE
jgi:hypothetical protein